MCEQNLMIGQTYTLTDGQNLCSDCCKWYSPPPRRAIYLGDFEPEVHRFKLKIPIICPLCGDSNDLVDYLCRDGKPINVTQEFLSLPVRSNNG